MVAAPAYSYVKYKAKGRPAVEETRGAPVWWVDDVP